VVDRASNGSTLTFSANIAVVGENGQALETLTGADFRLQAIDCGWGGPRDCASDAAGNATHNYAIDGGAQAFEYLPGGARHPWLAAVLVERGRWVYSPDESVPALKSFFTGLGNNDLASLLTIQVDGNATTVTQLGPYTSDGSTYLDAIDGIGIAIPSFDAPVMLQGVLDTIQNAAAAASGAMPGTEATVLVLAFTEMSAAERNEAAAFARLHGVHLSTVVRSYSNYAFPEMAVRTGGFATDFSDPRQLGMLFSAADSVLAGTMPYYRMQFRIGGPGGTFLPGGNAKAYISIRIPSDIPNHGVSAIFDVAVP
jgi:hypothetical protein